MHITFVSHTRETLLNVIGSAHDVAVTDTSQRSLSCICPQHVPVQHISTRLTLIYPAPVILISFPFVTTPTSFLPDAETLPSEHHLPVFLQFSSHKMDTAKQVCFRETKIKRNDNTTFHLYKAALAIVYN